MTDCPDHDELVRIRTIIDEDHDDLKKRVTALETMQNRIIGLGSILLVIAGTIGALLGRLIH